MRLTVTTWNINSVRLRIELVGKLLKTARPDVLCLQETKCPDDAFPLKRLKQFGYEHVALNGQKGYHGVAIDSKLIPKRSVLFIKETVGLPMPDGTEFWEIRPDGKLVPRKKS